MKLPFRKISSIGFVSCFAFTQILFAQSPENNFWETRRNSRQTFAREKGGHGEKLLFAQLTANVASATVTKGLTNDNPVWGLQASSKTLVKLGASKASPELTAIVQLLSRHGTVNKIQLGTGKGPILIHMQDVHGQRQAQENISALLSDVLEAHSGAMVGLEGAEAKDIDPTPFRSPFLEANMETGRFFFNTGYLTGAELPVFTAEKLPHYFGLEDRRLYLENVAAAKAALPRQARWNEILSGWNAKLAKEKAREYSPALAEIDQKTADRDAGRLSLGDFLVYLAGSRFPKMGKACPEVSAFLGVFRMEREIHFGKVEEERNRFLANLVERLTERDTQTLVESSVAFRSGQIPYADFYLSLRQTATRAGVPLTKYPQFNQYIHYVLAADSIRPEKLYAEMANLERVNWEERLTTSVQRHIYAADQDLKMAKKLIGLTMTPVDWQEFTDTRRIGVRSLPARFEDAHSDWTSDLAHFEGFYEKALARNHALADAVKAKIPAHASAKDIIVFVAGGFHAEGIAQLLHGNGTLITVSPKLESIDLHSSGGDYLSVFTREKLPLDVLFDSPKISLSDTPVIAPIGETKQAVMKLVGPLEGLVQRVLSSKSAQSETVGQVTVKCSPTSENTPSQITTKDLLLSGSGEKTKIEIWAKPGTARQTAWTRIKNALTEYHLIVPAVIVPVFVLGTLNLLSTPLPAQLLIGSAVGLWGINTGFEDYVTKHRKSHSETGLQQLRNSIPLVAVAGLMGVIGAYWYVSGLPATTLLSQYSLIFSVAMGGLAYTTAHVFLNTASIFFPGIAPASLSDGSGRPNRNNAHWKKAEGSRVFPTVFVSPKGNTIAGFDRVEDGFVSEHFSVTADSIENTGQLKIDENTPNLPLYSFKCKVGPIGDPDADTETWPVTFDNVEHVWIVPHDVVLPFASRFNILKKSWESELSSKIPSGALAVQVNSEKNGIGLYIITPDERVFYWTPPSEQIGEAIAYLSSAYNVSDLGFREPGHESNIGKFSINHTRKESDPLGPRTPQLTTVLRFGDFPLLLARYYSHVPDQYRSANILALNVLRPGLTDGPYEFTTPEGKTYSAGPSFPPLPRFNPRSGSDLSSQPIEKPVVREIKKVNPILSSRDGSYLEHQQVFSTLEAFVGIDDFVQLVITKNSEVSVLVARIKSAERTLLGYGYEIQFTEVDSSLASASLELLRNEPGRENWKAYSGPTGKIIIDSYAWDVLSVSLIEVKSEDDNDPSGPSTETPETTIKKLFDRFNGPEGLGKIKPILDILRSPEFDTPNYGFELIEGPYQITGHMFVASREQPYFTSLSVVFGRTDRVPLTADELRFFQSYAWAVLKPNLKTIQPFPLEMEGDTDMVSRGHFPFTDPQDPGLQIEIVRNVQPQSFFAFGIHDLTAQLTFPSVIPQGESSIQFKDDGFSLPTEPIQDNDSLAVFGGKLAGESLNWIRARFSPDDPLLVEWEKAMKKFLFPELTTDGNGIKSFRVLSAENKFPADLIRRPGEVVFNAQFLENLRRVYDSRGGQEYALRFMGERFFAALSMPGTPLAPKLMRSLLRSSIVRDMRLQKLLNDELNPIELSQRFSNWNKLLSSGSYFDGLLTANADLSITEQRSVIEAHFDKYFAQWTTLFDASRLPMTFGMSPSKLGNSEQESSTGSWFGNAFYKRFIAWVETPLSLLAGYKLAVLWAPAIAGAFGWDTLLVQVLLSGALSGLTFWVPHPLLALTRWGNPDPHNPVVKRLTALTFVVGALIPVVGTELALVVGSLLTGYHFHLNNVPVVLESGDVARYEKLGREKFHALGDVIGNAGPVQKGLATGFDPVRRLSESHFFAQMGVLTQEKNEGVLRIGTQNFFEIGRRLGYQDNAMKSVLGTINPMAKSLVADIPRRVVTSETSSVTETLEQGRDAIAVPSLYLNGLEGEGPEREVTQEHLMKFLLPSKEQKALVLRVDPTESHPEEVARTLLRNVGIDELPGNVRLAYVRSSLVTRMELQAALAQTWNADVQVGVFKSATATGLDRSLALLINWLLENLKTRAYSVEDDGHIWNERVYASQA